MPSKKPDKRGTTSSKSSPLLRGLPVPQWSTFGGPFLDFERTLETFLDERVFQSESKRRGLTSADCLDTLDTFYLAQTELLTNALFMLHKELVHKWLFRDMDTTYFDVWASMSLEQREETFLRAMEQLHVDFESEAAHFRLLLPELTLAGIAHDRDALRSLCRKLLSGGNDFADPKQRLFPIVHHDAFDRLWQLGAHEPPVPPTRSVRSAKQRNLVERHLFLLRFIGVICRKVANLPEPDISRVAPFVPFNEETAAGRLQQHSEDGKKGVLAAGARLPVQTCAACGARASHQCGRCRQVGKSVWYCSKKCQTSNWSVHSTTCGRDVQSLAFPAPPKPLHLPDIGEDRRFLLSLLIAHPSAVWGCRYHGKMFLGLLGEDEVTPDRRQAFLSCLRLLAIQAVRDLDPASIGAILLYLDATPRALSDDLLGKYELVVFLEIWTCRVLEVKTSTEASRLRDLAKEKMEASRSSDNDKSALWRTLDEFYQFNQEQAETIQMLKSHFTQEPKPEDDPPGGLNDEELAHALVTQMFSGADAPSDADQQTVADGGEKQKKKRNKKKKSKAKKVEPREEKKPVKDEEKKPVEHGEEKPVEHEKAKQSAKAWEELD